MKSTDAVQDSSAPGTSHDPLARAAGAGPAPAAARCGLDALPILPQAPTRVALCQSMVREAAYFRALQRGFAPGREIDDWLAAELEIGSRLP